MITKIKLKLEELRPRFIAAAQEIYDTWVQDEFDELNRGGICQDIANAFCDVLCSSELNIEFSTVFGDEHVWVVAYDAAEAFSIDIPYHIYEFGGGYKWTKIPNVVFNLDDLQIDPMERSLAIEAAEYF